MKMTDKQDQINILHEKLDNLLKRQDIFKNEILRLRGEINKLSAPETTESIVKKETKRVLPLTDKKIEIVANHNQTDQSQKIKEAPSHITTKVNTPLKSKLDIEKFIGENLINKIGIAITIIGVAIGAKYSIENDLISPLTRIILGYLTGIGLLGFGMKLKKKYESYSAVLVSGAIAIMYFITYAAYSFYGLFPQMFAFGLMVIFTIFTVIASINYNKQVIAHIGLVGAYSVPFLLSEGSGKIGILFSYMTIINVGILILSFKKYWKPLYYSSFGLTWLVFAMWYLTKYQMYKHFGLAMTFLTIFFVTFYLTSLAYKLIRKEKFEIQDVILLLSNSFIFYGLGFSILSYHEKGAELLGLFTLCNAILHFIVNVVIYKQKLADKNLFYLVTGLVLVFITIAIPVQLDGNWVTLFWVAEAALLFWVGRTKNIAIYEKLSYILMALAFLSIVHDWQTLYSNYYLDSPESRLTPLLNVNFLSSLLFIAAFGFIHYLNQNKKYQSAFHSQKDTLKVISFAVPIVLVFTIFYTLRMEIANYWDQLFIDSELNIKLDDNDYPSYFKNYDLIKYKSIWLINYTLFFLSVLSFVNLKRIKNRWLGLINLGLNTFIILVFLLQGLYLLSELRESYLEMTLSEYYQRGIFNIGIRYVSFAIVTLVLISCYQYIRLKFIQLNLRMPFDILLHLSILWILSSELIQLDGYCRINTIL